MPSVPVRTGWHRHLRYGCREGAESDLIPPAVGARVIEAAKALPFTHRTWADLEKALDSEDHDALLTLREMIESGVWDVKRLDAMAAVRAVAEGGVPKPAPPDAPAGVAGVPITGISQSQSMVRRSRREYSPGRWMSDLDVLDARRACSTPHIPTSTTGS